MVWLPPSTPTSPHPSEGNPTAACVHACVCVRACMRGCLLIFLCESVCLCLSVCLSGCLSVCLFPPILFLSGVGGEDWRGLGRQGGQGGWGMQGSDVARPQYVCTTYSQHVSITNILMPAFAVPTFSYTRLAVLQICSVAFAIGSNRQALCQFFLYLAAYWLYFSHQTCCAADMLMCWCIGFWQQA